MTPALNDLITGALALAGAETAAAHGGRIWHMEGGRRCPIGWWDCSQPVYVDLASGEHDYGEPGGPGAADCARHCTHGLVPPEPEDLSGMEAA